MWKGGNHYEGTGVTAKRAGFCDPRPSTIAPRNEWIHRPIGSV
jgi:hypothetical protein